MMTVILPRGQATLLRFADLKQEHYEPLELVIAYDVEPAVGSIAIHRRDKSGKQYRPLVIPMEQAAEKDGG